MLRLPVQRSVLRIRRVDPAHGFDSESPVLVHGPSGISVLGCREICLTSTPLSSSAFWSFAIPDSSANVILGIYYFTHMEQSSRIKPGSKGMTDRARKHLNGVLNANTGTWEL